MSLIVSAGTLRHIVTHISQSLNSLSWTQQEKVGEIPASTITAGNDGWKSGYQSGYVVER